MPKANGGGRMEVSGRKADTKKHRTHLGLKQHREALSLHISGQLLAAYLWAQKFNTYYKEAKHE